MDIIAAINIDPPSIPAIHNATNVVNDIVIETKQMNLNAIAEKLGDQNTIKRILG